jgi:hypothetical protein
MANLSKVVCHGESDKSRFGNPPQESNFQRLGIRERIFNALVENPDFEYLIIDSTIVRTSMRPAGSEDEAVWRSRGGLSTKISASKDCAR